MKKLSIIDYALFEYSKNLNKENFRQLKSEIMLFSKANEEKTDVDYSKELVEKFPYLEIIHDAFVRNKLEKISKDLRYIVNTIKITGIISLVFLIYYYLFG